MNNVLLFLKSIAFGIANLIPGLSGGTVALLTGMYEELVAKIDNTFMNIKNILSGRYESWRAIPYTYLAILSGGIAVGVISFVLLSDILLETFGIEFYSFLITLILMSSFHILAGVKMQATEYVLVLVGIITSAGIYYLSLDIGLNMLWLFILGGVAVSTLILPGLSGSLVLLIFGQYQNILSMLKDMTNNIPEIVTFLVGGLVGLVVTSHFLHEVLEEKEEEALALLTGMMIGGIISPINTLSITTYVEGLRMIIGLTTGIVLPFVIYFFK